MMKLRQIVIAIAAVTSVLFSGLILAAPPTPDVNVVNTPDVNVVNTPDVNVVNTISSGDLLGIDFTGAIASAGTVQVIFFAPITLRAITTSIAPDSPGDYCNVSVTLLPPDADPISIGLTFMSNGQASTVSRNYEIPIEGVQYVQWQFSGDAETCRFAISVAGETAGDSEAAQALRAEQPVRIEILE